MVITTAGLRITEHLVGATDLLEAIFRARLLIDVGVVLAGQSPIGAFEGVGIGIPADAEQLVVVSHQLVIPKVTVKAGVGSTVGITRNLLTSGGILGWGFRG